MTASLTTKSQKKSLRKDLRLRRKSLALQIPSVKLHHYFKELPTDILTTNVIGGFSPIGDEINIWPLLKILRTEGQRVALPVVTGVDLPLIFREWTPGCEMETDQYGVSFPAKGQTLSPQIILVPLLAFTPQGVRLGYGGGYYDRTLAALRLKGDVFACGVAYAGQEVAKLPTDAHDERLDGMLTEDGFRKFK